MMTGNPAAPEGHHLNTLSQMISFFFFLIYGVHDLNAPQRNLPPPPISIADKYEGCETGEPSNA